MQFLAAFLSSTFGGLVAVVAKYLTTKYAVAVAAIALFVAALGALWLALKALVAGIIYALPAGGDWAYLNTAFWLVVPDNFELCVSTMLSADLAVFLYKWHNEHVINKAT